MAEAEDNRGIWLPYRKGVRGGSFLAPSSKWRVTEGLGKAVGRLWLPERLEQGTSGHRAAHGKGCTDSCRGWKGTQESQERPQRFLWLREAGRDQSCPYSYRLSKGPCWEGAGIACDPHCSLRPRLSPGVGKGTHSNS